MSTSVQTVQAQIADQQQLLQKLRAIGFKLAEYTHRLSALKEQKGTDALLDEVTTR